MLKLKRKIQLQRLQNIKQSNQQYSKKKSNITKWVEQQLQNFKYSLTDQNSQFYVNNVIRQSSKLIVIEIYTKPKIGIFRDIEFRPKLYISCVDLVKRPKIYNDRRIYHPNINIETLQIIFPELVLDWNPTKKQQSFKQSYRLQHLLRKLNYILIEPNISFVPNNEFNKKAAIQYHFKRNQYREKIFSNMPIYLDELISSNNTYEKIQKQQLQLMEIEYSMQTGLINRKKQSEWFDVRSLYPMSIVAPKMSSFTNLNPNFKGKRNLEQTDYKDEEQIKLLAKQMKKVHVASDTQIQSISAVMDLQ